MTRKTTIPRAGWRAMLAAGLALLALVGAAAPASAASTPAPSGTVTGLLVTTAGTPAVGAYVGIEYLNDGEAYTLMHTRTDGAGRYTLTDVPEIDAAEVYPTFQLFAATPYITQVLVPALTVAADSTTTVPTATVTKGATVTGRVVSAVTGKPVFLAIVRDDGTQGATTTSDGRFTLRTDSLGGVAITAAKRGGYRAASTTVSVTENGTADAGTIALEPTKGHVRGRIVAMSGHPLSHVAVIVVGTGVATRGTTGRTRSTRAGRFSLRAKVGAYTVRISAPGRIATSRHAQIRPDGVLHLGRIVLAPSRAAN